MFAYEEAARILHSHFKGNNPSSVEEVVSYLKGLKNCFETTDLIYNFKFIRLEAEEIRSILNLDDSIDVPSMWIFDDGEVHFNGKVHSFDQDSKFKYVDKLPYSKSLHVYQDGEDLGIKEVYYSKGGYYNFGYGDSKLRALPGDWVIDGVYLNYKRMHDFKVYAIDDETGKKLTPETLFSKEQLEAVADWWGQYLPGYKDVNPREITKNIKFSDSDGEKEMWAVAALYQKAGLI